MIIKNAASLTKLTRNHYLPLWLLLLALLVIACTGCAPTDEEIEIAWHSSAHADQASPAFTNWDEAGEIDPNCAKCHSTFGYRDFLGLDGATAGQVDDAVPVGTTVECEACHNEVAGVKDSALMPSGAELTNLGANANCAECHQGRSSGAQITAVTTGQDADTVNEALSFSNIHNNPAAPTQFGSFANGGYEYEQKAYLQKYGHVIEFDSCISCHDAHSLAVDPQRCSACHSSVRAQADLADIRSGNIDYDGDGDIGEGIAGEIETMHERLLIAMQFYALRTPDVAEISYESDRRPHFFDSAGEAYSTWTPRLLRAAYNYRYVDKSPGDYAHHPLYTIQLLYDSLEELGFSRAGMTRPTID